MKSITKRWGVALLALMLSAVVIGCGSKAPESTEDEATQVETESQEEVAATEEEVTTPGKVNLLTGVEDLTDEAVGKRPVAIMVNNIQAAFPQYGISSADIIFEIPVEGGLTRFMAIYGDYTQVPKVCSVRSCRKYFPAFSEGFDAIYVHWGMNKKINAYVESLDLTRYNGSYNDGDLFAFDQQRKSAGYAQEHTGYFDGPSLPAALEEDGARVDIEDDKKDTAFVFCGQGETVIPTGEACTVVDVDYGAAEVTLKYDEATATYLKEHEGKAQKDGVTGEQLAFTNVFILEADITADSNGLHRAVDWSGGKGYYVSNGKVQKITWSKADEQSRLKFFDESGNDLVINRGKSYIGISYADEAVFQ